MSCFLTFYLVGYQNKTIASADDGGFTYLINPLQQVGVNLENQTLSAFNIPTNAGFMGSTSLTLEMYTKDGQYAGRYYFLDAGNAEFEGVQPGWYNADVYDEEFTWESANNAIIPFGAGVMIMSTDAEANVTFTGEVVNEAKTFTITSADDGGFTYCGNCSPVDLTLKDFAIPTDTGFMGSTSLTLEMYTKEGQYAGRYYFLDAGNAEFEGVQPGWYNADVYDNDFIWESAGDVTVESGRMFMIMSTDVESSITIPTAL